MEKWQAVGKTVEEAVENALKDAGLTRDQVEVKIIDAPSGGFFGFGKKMAKVEIYQAEVEENFLSGLSVSLKDEDETPADVSREERSRRKPESFYSAPAEITNEAIQTAVRFVEETAYHMGAQVQVKAEKREEEICVSVEGDQNGILIGKHGRTLDALQYLTGLAVHKVVEGRIRVIVDVEGYRERRKATLENLANRYANQAVERGSKLVLEPMNPQERRLIHMTLQEDSRISTESEGDEPFRKVVIIPKELTNDFVIYVEKFQRRSRDGQEGNRGFGDRNRRR